MMAAADPGVSTGDRALAIARTFLGTPYRHQGSRRGVGCDCLGLICGVWRELYGSEPEAPGAYAIDWFVRAGADQLTQAAQRHLLMLEAGTERPGDVLLFSWRNGAPATHCGILGESGRLIHAYAGSAVVASAMPHAWQRRVAGRYRFPDPKEA